MNDYEKLREYHRLNGHGNVPRLYKNDPALGDWVRRLGERDVY
jgi:hypothetical protein